MEIVRTLVERGAGLHNKNTTDDSAADIASRKHHNIILKYLQANGAYPEKHYGQNNASVTKRLAMKNTQQTSSPDMNASTAALRGVAAADGGSLARSGGNCS